MRTLYIDCGMGAAGDMLSAALFELFDDKEKLTEELNSLGIPTVSYVPEKTAKCGIMGTHMSVLVSGEEEGVGDNHDHEHDHDHHHDHEHHHDHDHTHTPGHHHSSMHDIERIIDGLSVSMQVKSNIKSVYRLIADAESYAHGVPVTDIHFHEVGTMDAVADVTAVCYMLDKLGIERVVASPVHVGSGQVHCAHGILPVPAPATAFILKGVPIYGGNIKSELCTPTGAALLKHFVDEFGDMPVMCTDKIGYGMGKKDFEVANCVRVMLGETSERADKISELFCNIDDMTPERISFAMERLFDAGAIEVFTTNVGMKKSRSGILLSVMCRMQDKEKILATIFKHTTTIGVRESVSKRYTLNRKMSTVSTDYGNVRVKSSSGYGTSKKKYEYEDLAKIARENDWSIEETIRKIEE